MLKLFTYQSFIINEVIIHHLMLQTTALKRNGLLYGKLGITIAFFECGKYWNNTIYTDYAKEWNNSFLSAKLGIADGLAEKLVQMISNKKTF